VDRPKDVRRTVEELRRRIEDARSQIDELSRQTVREARHGWQDFRHTWDDARRGWVDGANTGNGDGSTGSNHATRPRSHDAHRGTRWVMSSPTGPMWDRDDWWAWKQQRREQRLASRQRRRERRRQDTAWIGLVLLCIGVAWLAGETTSLRLPVEASLAAALIILGVVVLSTPKSRRLWPVVIGCAIIAVLMGNTARIGLPAAFRNSRMGNTAWAPRTVDDLQRGYSTSFGNLSVDLSCLAVAPAAPGSTPPPVTAGTIHAGAGNLTVFVPSTLPVRVDGHVTFGKFSIDGQRVGSGVNVEHQQNVNGESPRLSLPLDLFAGNLDVRTGAPKSSACATNG
jgi:predicted membrane protein